MHPHDLMVYVHKTVIISKQVISCIYTSTCTCTYNVLHTYLLFLKSETLNRAFKHCNCCNLPLKIYMYMYSQS